MRSASCTRLKRTKVAIESEPNGWCTMRFLKSRRGYSSTDDTETSTRSEASAPLLIPNGTCRLNYENSPPASAPTRNLFRVRPSAHWESWFTNYWRPDVIVLFCFLIGFVSYRKK